MGKKIEAFDNWMFKIFNLKIKNRFFDLIMPYYTRLGSLVFIVGLNLILLLSRNPSLKFVGAQMAVTLIISQSITYIVKAGLKRTRPYDAQEAINTYGMVLRDHSFPSGHSSASFSVAMVLALNFPKWALVFLILAFFVAISRVYLGVHYGSDIVAGIVLAILVSLVVYRSLYVTIFNYLFKRG